MKEFKQVKEMLERTKDIHINMEAVKGKQYTEAISAIAASSSFLIMLLEADAPDPLIEVYKMVLQTQIRFASEVVWEKRGAESKDAVKAIIKEMIVDSETYMSGIIQPVKG